MHIFSFSVADYPMFVQSFFEDSFCFSNVGVSWEFLAGVLIHCSIFVEDVVDFVSLEHS